MQKKQKLWSAEGRAALAFLPLEPWTDRRRHDLLNLLSMLDEQLQQSNDAVIQVATQYPDLLMSQTRSGCDRHTRVCPDHWRCLPLPPWQAGR
jgi:transposase